MVTALQTNISAEPIEVPAVYCECCMVVAVNDGDKYCIDCVNDIVESLAQQAREQQACEKGLY